MTQVIDFIGGEYRIRTGVHGFAIRCVATPPTRQRNRLTLASMSHIGKLNNEVAT